MLTIIALDITPNQSMVNNEVMNDIMDLVWYLRTADHLDDDKKKLRTK
jgi:hypothetical protein